MTKEHGMLSEDTTGSTDTMQEDEEHSTEALERVPRMPSRRSMQSEKRQTILQQKQTDLLPAIAETPTAKVAWRQMVQLREENRRLRYELEESRVELQGLINEYKVLQQRFDGDITAIHSAHQQELEQYQTRIHELMEEQATMQEEHQELERRYQDLYHTFQKRVDEEARKMVMETTRTIELSEDDVMPPLLQDVKKTLELQVRQEEDKHMMEVLFLKREIERMAGQLEQEQTQIEEERQKLLTMQNTVREQAELRQKTLQSRLRTRWKLVSAATTVGLMLVLVALQFIFLGVFHIPIAGLIELALLIPIVACVILALLLNGPLATLKLMYTSAPHKKRQKKG